MVTKKSISEEQLEIQNLDSPSYSLQKETLEMSEATVPAIQRRVSSKQRKLSLDEYRNVYLRVPKIEDRKPIFVSCEVRDRLDEFVRKLGSRRMSVSGLLENIARQHLEIYLEEFEQWRKL